MAAEIENLMKARLKLDMLAGLIHEFTLLIRSLQENYKAEAVPDPVQDQIGYLPAVPNLKLNQVQEERFPIHQP